MHGPSDVRYALNGICSALTAVVGVDDEVGAAGSIVFQVYTDDVLRFDSGVMTGTSANRSVSVDLTGANQLALIVTNGIDDPVLRSRRLGERADHVSALKSPGNRRTAPSSAV